MRPQVFVLAVIVGLALWAAIVGVFLFLLRQAGGRVPW